MVKIKTKLNTKNTKVTDSEELEDLEEDEEEILGSKNALFTCPQCGEIDQDDVIFTCNVCDSNELLYKDGVYMCPQCFDPGENFQCMLCGSKEVTLTFKDEENK